MFADENALLIHDLDHSDDEDRFVRLGLSAQLKVLVVCHSYRRDQTSIRIFSARKATRFEQKQYWERWSWDDANTAAASQTFNGMQGHLATITSASENDFIYNNFSPGESAWIGGYQLDNQSTPQVGWRWVTGELFSFLHWDVNQPNDDDAFSGTEDNEENCIEFDVNGSWNDLGCSNGLLCYVVEYEQESIPTMTQWGMIVFIVFAGVGAVYYMRRQRKAER